MKKNVLISVVVLSVLAAGIALTWERNTTDDGWQTLTPGSPDAAAPNLVGNGNFNAAFIADWHEMKEVSAQPENLSHGERVAEAGRGGSPALHFPPAMAKSARLAAIQTVMVSHADFFLDGFVRKGTSTGQGWVGVEITFDGKSGPLATYLAYLANPGTAAPQRDNALVLPLADAGGEWLRLPLRTTWDLRKAGLALKEPPVSVTIRLWMELRDGSSEAWFDDIELRDMKVGRGAHS